MGILGLGGLQCQGGRVGLSIVLGEGIDFPAIQHLSNERVTILICRRAAIVLRGLCFIVISISTMKLEGSFTTQRKLV